MKKWKLRAVERFFRKAALKNQLPKELITLMTPSIPRSGLSCTKHNTLKRVIFHMRIMTTYWSYLSHELSFNENNNNIKELSFNENNNNLKRGAAFLYMKIITANTIQTGVIFHNNTQYRKELSFT